ncbi:MAG: PaaI family thioesterase [Candidatus Obscuribacterales bacterium]|nr:PaaI family thioesterase [Candidatus Obscuribacterales bacterium]
MAKYEWTMLSAIGGTIIELREGYALGELPLSDGVKQPTGVFHAGAIVALADEVASAAIMGGVVDPEQMQGRKFPYSIQLSVNLLTNDPEGPLRAEANVVKEGGITVVDTVVTARNGATVALMRSTHRMVDPRKHGPHKRKS